MKTFLAATGLALVAGTVGVLSLPSTTSAFSLIGGSLGTGQRDFRVFNNFTDASANNNVTPHVNFPGQTGAVMAIWKGHVEWGSGPWGGNGLGDGVSSNPNLGDGGANFDNKFEGVANAVGNNNGNIHSELSGSGGSTLAFTETPISDGWRIRYYSSWTWQDGPGSVGSGIDIQGVACHEIGHSLGLGHSAASGATMLPAISGTGVGQRSINSDDIAGVQAIYGVKSASKPTITSIGGDKSIGGLLTISGSQFSATGNTVLFTDANADSTSVTVGNVSSTGGGTLISVTVPTGAADGDVQVQKNATGHSSLSIAFPIDVGVGTGDPPDVTSINPTLGPAGGWSEVVISGTGFAGTTSVKFGTKNALSFQVDSPTQITAVTPSGTAFTTVDVVVQDGDGIDTLPSAFFYVTDPAPNVSTVTPDQGSLVGGTEVTISGSSVVGVHTVTFGGVAGTDLDIVSPTELTVVTPAGSEGLVNVAVTNNTSTATIVNGFEYTDPGQFINIGPGVGGLIGPSQLTGSGDLAPGSSEGFSITMSNALSGSSGTLFVSFSQGAAPFKGGTFYPVPILLSIPLVVDLLGGFQLSSNIPVGTPPGLSFVMQTWNSDFTAPAGLTGSNGLKAIVP